MSKHTLGFDTRLKQHRLDAFADQRFDRSVHRSRQFNHNKLTKDYFFKHYKTEYKLYRGDDFIGRSTEMTSSESFKLNAEYEDTFYKKLKTDEDARLYRWKSADTKQMSRDCNAFVKACSDFNSDREEIFKRMF